MIIFGNIQLALYLLSVLQSVISSPETNSSIKVMCETLRCFGYKSNEARCPGFFLVGDPLTRECKPKCWETCQMGECRFCFCALPSPGIPTEQLIGCTSVYNIKQCHQTWCPLEENYCNKDYVISPYDENECIRRCNYDSCKNGKCSLQGTCVCDLGYRLDPLNPTTCIEIPALADTNQVKNGAVILGNLFDAHATRTKPGEVTSIEYITIIVCVSIVSLVVIVGQAILIANRKTATPIQPTLTTQYKGESVENGYCVPRNGIELNNGNVYESI